MGSSTKTITDMAIEPMSEYPENVFRDLFLNVGRQSRNGGKAVTDTFGSTIRQMNGILQPKLVAKMGYGSSYDMPYSAISANAVNYYATEYLNSNSIIFDSVVRSEIKEPTYKDAIAKRLTLLDYDFDPVTLNYTNMFQTHIYVDAVITNTAAIAYYYIAIDADSSAVAAWKSYSYPDITSSSESGELSTTYSILSIGEVELNRSSSVLQRLVTIQKITTTVTTIVTTNPTTGVTSTSTKSSTVVDEPFIATFVVPSTQLVVDSPYAAFASHVATYNNYVYKAFVPANDYMDVINVPVHTTYTSEYTYSVSVPAGNYSQHTTSEAINYVVSKIEEFDKQVFIVITYTRDGKTYIIYDTISNMSDMYVTKHTEALPLIPLKQNFTIIEKNKKLNKLLGEIGVNQSMFKTVLETPELHSAYLSFLTPVDLEVPELVNYAHKFFSIVAPEETSRINFTQQYGNDESARIDWIFNVTNSTISGNIGMVDDVVSSFETTTITEIGWLNKPVEYTVVALTLRKQLTTTTYNEIVASGTVNYAFQGYTFGDGGSGEWSGETGYGFEAPLFRLPLLRDVFIAMPFNEKCFIFGKSLSLTAFMLKKIKVKWYQTGFFKMVLMAVSIVLMVWAGVPPGWIMASVGLQMAVMAGLITGKVAMIIGIVMALVSGNFQSMIANAAENTLALASMLVNVVSSIYGMVVEAQIAGYAKDANAAIAAAEEAKEEYKEEADTLGNPINLFGATLDYDSYWYIASGEVQYAYDSLYDYDTAIFNTDSKTSIGM